MTLKETLDSIIDKPIQAERMCNHTYILISEQAHRVIKCQKCDNTQPI